MLYNLCGVLACIHVLGTNLGTTISNTISNSLGTAISNSLGKHFNYEEDEEPMYVMQCDSIDKTV